VGGARAAHFAAVRRMLEELDVLVFTLGLTEAWRSKEDGAVFPLAPGVAAGAMDESRYEFVNFRVTEVIEDLEAFLARLFGVNPHARIILTVSPVPLIATYENRHVLTSTTYSKSVLRVAAEEVARDRSNIWYFPSYEIITGNFNRGAYFDDDLRSIKPEGIDHVMRLFFAHGAVPAVTQPGAEDGDDEADELLELVCDEEAIDAVEKPV
jgi:hypothetical protein